MTFVWFMAGVAAGVAAVILVAMLAAASMADDRVGDP